MSKLLASLALLALLAAGRGAGAAEAEATGWITHLDHESDQIVLDGGRIFGVSEEINFSSLKDGVRVRIRYDKTGVDKIATEIMLAPEAPHSAVAPRSGTAAPFCAKDHHNDLEGNFTVRPDPFC
ncbi:MAG: DUF1344 domain-containing protein [Proteobacteria bacterium]|nr:DUF1344 domain-containing protein [Pseudomonadota bacterium]